MGYVLTDEQKDLKKLISDFMMKEVVPVAHQYDESGEFPLAVYKKGFDLGFNMLDLPEEYGGAGLDPESYGILLEEMGRLEPGFGITILTNSLAAKCVLYGGSEELKKKIMAMEEEGAMGAFALTEPDSGSDAASLSTKYRKEGDEYILNGTKCFITNGEYADFYIVFATKDKNLGAKGISAFLVEKGAAGFTTDKHENKMGIRLSNTCGLSFNDVRIPAGNLLGKEGEGFKIAMADLDAGRLNNASIAAGICQAALDAAVAYAKQRITFGKPIIRHPVVGAMLADMATQTEAARQLVRYGMFMLNRGEAITKEAAMAKTFCSDTAVKVTSDAVQIFGGYGYSKEYPVEKMMRDAKIFQIFEGTNQIQKLVISRALAK